MTGTYSLCGGDVLNYVRCSLLFWRRLQGEPNATISFFDQLSPQTPPDCPFEDSSDPIALEVVSHASSFHDAQTPWCSSAALAAAREALSKEVDDPEELVHALNMLEQDIPRRICHRKHSRIDNSGGKYKPNRLGEGGRYGSRGWGGGWVSVWGGNLRWVAGRGSFS